MVSRGRAAAYKQTHARILLLSDENQAEGPIMDQEIARSLKVGTATVERVRRRCVEEGVAAALGRKEQLNRRRKKLDGQGEAHLIAFSASIVSSQVFSIKTSLSSNWAFRERKVVPNYYSNLVLQPQIISGRFRNARAH